MLLMVVQVLGARLSAPGATMGLGARRDVPALDAREATLEDIAVHSALLPHQISPAVAVVLERQVHIVVKALDGVLIEGAQVAVFLCELNAVEQHVNLGFHPILVAMPLIANHDHQLFELRYHLVVHGGAGEQEGA